MRFPTLRAALRAAAFTGAVLSCWGCAGEKPVSNAEPPASESRLETGYVSGIAAAYYCTCDKWPSSWAELHRFDDYLHTRSEQAGEAPMKRFDWRGVNAAVGVNSAGSLLIRPDTRNKDNLAAVAVPAPECAKFDRTRFAGGCVSAAAAR